MKILTVHGYKNGSYFSLLSILKPTLLSSTIEDVAKFEPFIKQRIVKILRTISEVPVGTIEILNHIVGILFRNSINANIDFFLGESMQIEIEKMHWIKKLWNWNHLKF